MNTIFSSATALTNLSLSTAILGCLAINVIGLRFLLVPSAATTAYGIQPTDVKGLTAIKGIRDITSGIVPLVIWRVAGPVAFGYAMMAAAITPIGDMLVVLQRGGKVGVALGVHGLTAVVLIAAGWGMTRV